MPPEEIVGDRHPLVSVVIPAYNAGQTAPRAIESVISQTYANWEIVVVDDGSTDDLETALRDHLPQIRLIRQPRGGAGRARNSGAAHATGEFLAFLDADDFWDPRKLELQVNAFAHHPNAALCATQSIPPLPAIPRLQRITSVAKDGDLVCVRDFRQFFLNPYIGTPGVMIRKGFFESLGGFRTDLTSAEDVDLWLRAAYHGTVVLIPEPLFTITSSPTSLTARHMDGTYRDNLRVIEDFCTTHPEFAKNHRDCVLRMKSVILSNWGSEALVRGDFELAKDALLRSISHRTSARGLALLIKTHILRATR